MRAKTKAAHAIILGSLIILSLCTPVLSQDKLLISADATPQDLGTMVESQNTMRPIIMRFTVDLANLNRIYEIQVSAERFSRMESFYRDWLKAVEGLDFATMSQDAKVDYILFNNFLQYRLRALSLEKIRFEETEALIPFASTIVALQEKRRRLEPVDSELCATILNDLEKQISDLQAENALLFEKGELAFSKPVCVRTSAYILHLQETLKKWFDYYYGYDPLFTWWTKTPYENVNKVMAGYAEWLRLYPGGEADRKEDDVFGDPVGRDALIADLQLSMIPYTPEELIEIGKAEYAWCEQELIKASRELGFGDDWLKAVEHVKSLHVEPGKQPEVIRDLAYEAIAFIRERDLMTIPQLAVDTWRMEMMTPERQLLTPFFTGGPTISVSFPTDTMEHEDKLMSLRGNNIHFSRATVHHELIPGHHMQSYVNSRFNTHRMIFYTPFWTEGWALYWEMLLWDQDFPQSPENRIGMLFWRIHRCARIIFSLSFHLGTMTPQESIDFLVERVGHERANAIAEVRRSFESYYGPLYQAAYMIGGLQFRALHKELVDGGVMTNREFHDAIMQMNNIPVEMVRALLTNQELPLDFSSQWKFYGEVKTGEEAQH